VVLRGRIELDRAHRAVVVGDHQAFWRDEARGAAAQRHHRVQRRLRQVGERRRIALVTGGLELGGDGRQLRRQPHAFVGAGRPAGGGNGGGEAEGGQGGTDLHGGLRDSVQPVE